MNYAVRQIGDVIILDLSGRYSLDDALALGPGSALVLRDLVRDQEANGHTKILLNLHEVSYIDSSGVGDLVSCLITLRNQGGQLRICNATARIRDLLLMTHLDTALNFEKDEATALPGFQEKPAERHLGAVGLLHSMPRVSPLGWVVDVRFPLAIA